MLFNSEVGAVLVTLVTDYSGFDLRLSGRIRHRADISPLPSFSLGVASAASAAAIHLIGGLKTTLEREREGGGRQRRRPPSRVGPRPDRFSTRPTGFHESSMVKRLLRCELASQPQQVPRTKSGIGPACWPLESARDLLYSVLQ